MSFGLFFIYIGFLQTVSYYVKILHVSQYLQKQFWVVIWNSLHIILHIWYDKWSGIWFLCGRTKFSSHFLTDITSYGKSYSFKTHLLVYARITNSRKINRANQKYKNIQILFFKFVNILHVFILYELFFLS